MCDTSNMPLYASKKCVKKGDQNHSKNSTDYLCFIEHLRGYVLVYHFVSYTLFFYKHGPFSAEPQRAYEKACYQTQTCLVRA